jgi:hypothetical protein
MKFLDNLANALAFVLQVIIVGLVLAYLRHSFRFLYYPLKWILTIIMSFMLGAFCLAAFKLITDILFGSGSTNEGFSNLMDFMGSSNHFVEASTFFILTLLVVGSFVGSFIDTVIYHIELTLFSGSVMRYDPVLKDTVTVTSQVWNPNAGQSLMWNLYGFGVIIFLWFRLTTM